MMLIDDHDDYDGYDDDVDDGYNGDGHLHLLQYTWAGCRTRVCGTPTFWRKWKWSEAQK